MSFRDSHALTAVEPGQPSSHAADARATCRKKFLRFFPAGFTDPKYIAWERGYKQAAHEEWQQMLGQSEFKALLRKKKFMEIAARAVRIESRTNLLFSFEKMAIRDAVKSRRGAEQFARGLYLLLYGKMAMAIRFRSWLEIVKKLPRKQTRVFTWPVATVFGFIAQPAVHIFLKPTVTKKAAAEFEFDFAYESAPSWKVYAGVLRFGQEIKKSLDDFPPVDQIDVQSFIWVLGSDEYAA